MNIDETLIGWTDSYFPLSLQFNSLYEPIFKNNTIEDKIKFTLANLSMSCAHTSESTLLLIRHGRLWDADILFRSILEGSMKFIYLCNKNSDNRTQLNEEYSIVLPEMVRIRRESRLQELFNVLLDKDAPEWEAFRKLQLSKEELERLTTQFPRKLRDTLEQKWSFTKIVGELAQSNKNTKVLSGFFHIYGLCSHLVHKDSDGVDMIWERSLRPDVRRNAVHLAHAARLFSDLFALSLLRLFMAFDMLELPKEPLSLLEKQAMPLLDELGVAQKNWNDIEYGVSS